MAIPEREYEELAYTPGEFPPGLNMIGFSLWKEASEKEVSHHGFREKVRRILRTELKHREKIGRAKAHGLEVVAFVSGNGPEIRIGKKMIATMGGIAAVVLAGGIILYPRIKDRVIDKLLEKKKNS